MINLLRTWLFGLTAVSALLALAEPLVTQGGIRRVLRLTGGVLMTLILLQPVLRIDLEDLDLSLQLHQRETEDLREEYVRQQEAALRTGIEQELASYIWDKARELGIDCQVRVTAETGEDGVPLPAEVAVDAPYSEELSAVIQKDLGVPRENQMWQEAS